MEFMKRTHQTLLVAAALLMAAPAIADAGHGCTVCATTPVRAQAAPCCVEPQMVEKTVMVPKWGTEKRTVTVTEYVREPRTRTYTAHKRVPRIEQITRDCTVMVPVRKSKEVVETVAVPHFREVEKSFTVRVPKFRTVEHQVQIMVPRWKEVPQEYVAMVPEKQTRTGVRNVCRMEPVVVQKTYHRDEGHWDERQVEVPTVTCSVGPRRPFFRRGCNDCGTAGCGPVSVSSCGDSCATTHVVTRKVWVPNVVTETKDVTVMKPKMTQEEYQYTVTVCRPEKRVRNVRVCEMVPQTRTVTRKVCEYEVQHRTKMVRVCEMRPQERTRTVHYTVCEPKQVTKTYNVTKFDVVPEQRTTTYTVCVPKQVQKEVAVPVCHMVPKTVMVPAGCSTCSSGGPRRGLLGLR
jgi:hypothetical protein